MPGVETETIKDDKYSFNFILIENSLFYLPGVSTQLNDLLNRSLSGAEVPGVEPIMTKNQ